MKKFVTALFLLCCVSRQSWAQTPEWRRGLAKVKTLDSQRAAGTAFVFSIKDNVAFLITGSHVVEGDNEPLIEFLTSPDRTYRATTIASNNDDRTRGLAILRVSDAPSTLLAFSSGNAIQGAKVIVAGFPAPSGIFSLLDPIISRVEGLDLVLSQPTDIGYSGGPVLQDGKVVGVVFGRQGIGLALRAEAVGLYARGYGFSWSTEDQNFESIVDFRVEPNRIEKGNEALLRWTVAAADSVSISGLGAVDLRGQRRIAPSATTKYILTARSSAGTRQAEAELIVTEPQPPSSPGPGSGGPIAPVKTHLKVGDMAPDFELASTNGGQKMMLSGFKGRNTVVLAFFPAAFTGGCTKEMTAYTGDIARFQAAGAQVFGISSDPLPSLNYWSREVIHAPFPMLSDFTTRKTLEAYGIMMPNGMASRTTFVVDRDGIIRHIDEGATAVDINGAATACSRLKK